MKLSIVGLSLSIALMVGTTGCGDRSDMTSIGSSIPNPLKRQPIAKITEVSPPEPIQKLRQLLERYQPQVAIASPQPNQTLQETTVTLELNVRDLPIYQDSNLGLGPHLEVILDNEPYTRIYDLSQPITFSDLNPGTHTLRVFAVSPWGESFKNEGAYAQTTFHIFTPTENRIPNPNVPLLTYSNPIGTYGAEPILLDFYLTNAPLHLVAAENSDDDILDWRIRAYVNGEEFILDQWQPLYLQGFDPGKNWIKLEILDELGNPIENVFNTTARLITYDRNASDSLSQLIRGEIPVEAAQGIVDPNWSADLSPTPEPSPEEIETEEPLDSERPNIEQEEAIEIPEAEDVEQLIEEATEIPAIEEAIEEELEILEESELQESEPLGVEITEPLPPESSTPDLSVTEEPANIAQPEATEPSETPSWRKSLNVNRWRETLKSRWNQLDLNSINPFGKQSPEMEVIPEVEEELPISEEITEPSLSIPESEEIEERSNPSELELELVPDVIELETIEPPLELDIDENSLEVPTVDEAPLVEESVETTPVELPEVENSDRRSTDLLDIEVDADAEEISSDEITDNGEDNDISETTSELSEMELIPDGN